MRDREFYERLLGLREPWKVKAVRMDLHFSAIFPKLAVERRWTLDPTEFRLSSCERSIGGAEVFLAQPRELHVRRDIKFLAILER